MNNNLLNQIKIYIVLYSTIISDLTVTMIITFSCLLRLQNYISGSCGTASFLFYLFLTSIVIKNFIVTLNYKLTNVTRKEFMCIIIVCLIYLYILIDFETLKTSINYIIEKIIKK